MDEQEVWQQLREDDKSRAFLRALRYYGDEATTSDIRSRTGLDKSPCQYRFKKLEDLGLIEVNKADSGHGDRDPPRVAQLTGFGRSMMESGIAPQSRDDEGNPTIVISSEEWAELRNELRKQENRIDALTHNRMDMQDMDDRVGGLTSWVYTLRYILENEFNVDFEAKHRERRERYTR